MALANTLRAHVLLMSRHPKREGHNTHSKPTMMQMLTLQRALERVESNKRGQQIQSPTVRLKIKQL